MIAPHVYSNRAVTIDNRATWWITRRRTFPRRSARYTRVPILRSDYASPGIHGIPRGIADDMRHQSGKLCDVTTGKRQLASADFPASHRERSSDSAVSSRWNSPRDESLRKIKLKSISRKYLHRSTRCFAESIFSLITGNQKQIVFSANLLNLKRERKNKAASDKIDLSEYAPFFTQ